MSILALIFLSLFVLTSASALLSLPLERLDWWLKAISAGLAGLTVAVGIGAFIVGEKVSDIQKDRIVELGKETAVLNKEVAEARTKQAEAELQLVKLKKAREPRISSVAAFKDAIKDKPVGEAEVLYQDGDGEAATFAIFLKSVLVYSGWKVSGEAEPIGDKVSGMYSGIPQKEILKFSPPMRLGATPVGVTIVSNSSIVVEEITPQKGLLQAFAACDIRAGIGYDHTLPDGLLRIVVAQKE